MNYIKISLDKIEPSDEDEGLVECITVMDKDKELNTILLYQNGNIIILDEKDRTLWEKA